MGEVLKGYSYTYANYANASNTASVLSSGATFLGSIIINKTPNAETITIYDNTAAATYLVGTITGTITVGMSFPFNCLLSKGLTIKCVSTVSDFTVTYAKV
jgi:hypothetical protein